jgi:hypothetical protein
VLAVMGAFSTAWLLGSTVSVFAESATIAGRATETVALLAFALGPVAAVWRYDLREEGMLGDAGANPMGAVAGLLIVAGLPLWALVVYFAVMLGLNVASERVSFSAVIERTGWLRRIDLLGRVPEAVHDVEAKSGKQSETNPE